MKVWFITGASRGLGTEITQAVLEGGDAVVAAARDARAIAERFGDHPNLLPLALDVIDETQALSLIHI